jgi:hypothetical protein
LTIPWTVYEPYGSWNCWNFSLGHAAMKTQILLFPTWTRPLTTVEQIISILDIIKPPTFEAFKEIYCRYDPVYVICCSLYAAVIQELMETDLHKVIQTRVLTDAHFQVRVFTKGQWSLMVIHFAVLYIPDPSCIEIHP